MLRNAIAQEIPNSLAPSVAHSDYGYYGLIVGTIIVLVLVGWVCNWWTDD